MKGWGEHLQPLRSLQPRGSISPGNGSTEAAGADSASIAHPRAHLNAPKPAGRCKSHNHGLAAHTLRSGGQSASGGSQPVTKIHGSPQIWYCGTARVEDTPTKIKGKELFWLCICRLLAKLCNSTRLLLPRESRAPAGTG